MMKKELLVPAPRGELLKPNSIPDVVVCRRCGEYPCLLWNSTRPVYNYKLKCGCKIRSCMGGTRREVIKKWNKRQGKPFKLGGVDEKYK